MNDSSQRGHLDPRAASALDALVEVGFDPDALDAPIRTDGQTIARLLANLDLDMPEGAPLLGGPNARDARLLVEVTAARVLRSRERGLAGAIGTPESKPHLAPADADDLDELVSGGWSTGQGGSRVAAFLELLNTDLPEGQRRSTLIEATLARLQQQIDEGDSRMRIDTRRAVPA
ncbi:MAG: hypothetical protein KDA21_09865 [Phycisphaerales bacterium]|nr:hypothetical protein [Phycisphaerales bacterium]